MTHRLDPLLRPRSVAVVGASARAESLGEWSLKNLLRGGFSGDIYPVNPNYNELQGYRCYANLAELPTPPDLVIFGVGDQRIEAALDDAVAAGVPAAVIMSTTVIDDDAAPVLQDRLRRKINDTGMLVCGSNCMGFYNVRDHVWACGFDSAMHHAPGNITLISHSGAGMSGIIDCDERVRINLAVSTGNELSVTMDQYLDFALDLPETRVVGLFVETARNPSAFRAALEKANQRRIPIVAIKVGRTEESARLTVSHSGAMAGDDAAYEALFDRYGVQRVRDMDQLATTLIMFAELHPVGMGGLVTLHDSGGERQLIIDLADDADVPLTKLSPATVAKLEQVLDPELPAVNPLDGWSRGASNYAQQMTESLTLMMQDEGAALGAAILNRAPAGLIYPVYLDYIRGAHAASGKPVALVAARQGTGSDQIVTASTHAGLPILDGVSGFLQGVQALFAYRDFLQQEDGGPPGTDRAALAAWRQRLQLEKTPGEARSMQLLADLGMPAPRVLEVDNEDGLSAAAAQLGFPLALKTAAPGIAHKSEQGGVLLNIADESALLAAYRHMSSRLGSAVLLAPMAGAGVEMILGATHDPQFGPVVVIGFGGVLAETLNDVVFALPPFAAEHARRCVDRLQLRPLLDGVRGQPALDIDAFCAAAARFSAIVAALCDQIEEVDINPLIVHEKGCTVADALIIAN
ncbi:MAG: acetate--CoA ligase family protein [Gammaproteobacteria bacterium]|nr:acetate--CoA ligase family protein [Gammaproteobacteria bacterium]